MRLRTVIIGLALLLLFVFVAGRGRLPGVGGSTAPSADYPVKPVPFTSVTFSGGFWTPRIETNRRVTIPFAFKQSEETGRIRNFEIAGGMAEGQFCSRYAFDDSDVYKVIEGASYSLAQHPDPELDTYLDGLIGKIAAAQEKDGYLYTNRTINPAAPMAMAGKQRWVNLESSHELYNLGHLYEAAVAHHAATGKRTLLDVALKSANLVATVFGPNGRKDPPGHQEIEIGLAKLYRLTGQRKYLDLARFFLDQRGNAAGHKLYGEYSQDHIPVLEQREAVGHSVRATYMYTGMADIAALTGDTSYIGAIDRLWEDVVGTKMYLTGGIGAAGSWEGFGPAYELPNASAYAETCASIANGLWNYRMFLLHADAKYIDVFERIIYNGLLSGYALTGDKFFYPNPLASFGQHERSPWFACACCPSNVPRFIPSLPGYTYAVDGNTVFVNLFAEGEGTVKTASGDLRLRQETAYPWSGAVKMTVSAAPAEALTVKVRIPGWARNQPVPSDLYRYADTAGEQPVLMVNGEAVPLKVDRGYAAVERTWKPGDVVELALPMPVRRVVSHPSVKANENRVAIERGPLVYAAEWPDNQGHVSNLLIDDAVTFAPESRPDLLNGVTVLRGEATAYAEKGGKPAGARQPVTLIPYYAWAHRGKGEMAVWLARDMKAVRPVAEPTLASRSTATGSQGAKGIEAINDLFEPENSNDHSVRYLHWWPKKGSVEWVQYDFPAPATVSEVSVYWFDDTGQGSCRVPASWKLFYKDGDGWVPVKAAGAYGVEKDRYNVLRFQPVRTSALKLELQLPAEFASGIQEWKVK